MSTSIAFVLMSSVLTIGLQSVASAGTVTGTIPTGTNPLDIALNSGGTVAYVANFASNTVSVVALPADTLTTTIFLPANSGPSRVVVDSTNTYAYVTNMTSGTVTQIQLSDNSIHATLTLPAGSNPEQIALTSSDAYVADRGTSSVSVIALPAFTLTTPLTPGTGPEGIVVIGTDAYVTNRTAGTVSVLPLAGGAAVATITVGTSPTRIAKNPGGTDVYVTNSGSGNVSVIQVSTNTVVATVTVGTTPDAVAVDPSDTYAYVSNTGTTTVSVIQLSSNTVVQTITVGTGPEGIAVNSAGTFAYAVNFSSNNGSVISLASATVTFLGGTGTITGSTAPETASVPTALTTNGFARAGFTFNGWNTAANGSGTPYAAGATYPFSSSTNLYAQWAVPADTDNYSYAAGTGGSGSGPAASSGADGSTITLAANTFVNAGHTFTGWNDGTTTHPAGFVYTLLSAGTPIVFTAQWSLTDSYSYAAGIGGSGTAPAASSGADGSTITLAANTFVNAGNTFTGWNDGTATHPAGFVYTLASAGTPIVFTAVWTANATDSYSYAAGTGGSGTPPTGGSGPNGGTITLAANTFVNAGHTFAGWSDGTATDAAGFVYTLASTPIVFTAVWAVTATDNYSYAAGTGGSGTAPTAGSGANGTTITLAANTFVNAGNTFAGWNDGTTTDAAGFVYTLASGGAAIVFTAQWTPIGGGGGGGGGGVPATLSITAASQTVTVGSPVTASATVGGLTSPDTGTVTSATYTYAGSGTTVYAASTTAPTVAGTYSVTPSAATVSISPSADASKYSTTYSYVGGVLTINPVVVVVPPVVVVGPHATRVVGQAFVGKSRTLTIVGSNFTANPGVTSNGPGAVVRVHSKSANRIVLSITVRKGTRPGTHLFTITASGKKCRIGYITR